MKRSFAVFHPPISMRSDAAYAPLLSAEYDEGPLSENERGLMASVILLSARVAVLELGRPNPFDADPEEVLERVSRQLKEAFPALPVVLRIEPGGPRSAPARK